MANTTSDGLRDPLTLVPGELWMHGAFMLIGAGIMLPIGAMLARQGSTSHRFVQGAAVLIVLMGVVLSLISEALENIEGPRDHSRKRHLEPLIEGQPHSHATMHSVMGLLIVCTLVGQAVIGCGSSSHARGSTFERLKRFHRIVGRVLVVFIVPVQLGTGVVALFQLCSPELSGVDQCVGHNAVGGAMLLAAATYWYWGDRPDSASTSAPLCRYDTSFVENGAALTGSLLTIMYSFYSEYPYDEHPNGVHHLAAGCVLAVLTLLALYLTWRAREASVPMGQYVLRGAPIVLTGVVAGSLMFAHHQMNDYGRTMHILFGISLYFVAAARAARWFKTLAFFIVLGAFFFMASQRGFQVLYARFYHDRFPAGAAAVVLVLASCILFFGATLCARRARKHRPTPTTPRRVEDAHVEEILALGSDDAPPIQRSKAAVDTDNFLRENPD